LGFAPLRSALNLIFFARDLPWFVFGIGCFFLSTGHDRKACLLMSAAGVYILAYTGAAEARPFLPELHSLAYVVGMIVIFALMICSIKSPRVSSILSFRLLASIGLTSYSLYLIHQEVGEEMISLLGNPLHLSPDWAGLYGLAVLALMIVFSTMFFRYVEKPANHRVRQWMSPARS
jgi:peptidoglycan/LPS O-acetylase OafA/YrhL